MRFIYPPLTVCNLIAVVKTAECMFLSISFYKVASGKYFISINYDSLKRNRHTLVNKFGSLRK